jgi:hypothetical protein
MFNHSTVFTQKRNSKRIKKRIAAAVVVDAAVATASIAIAGKAAAIAADPMVAAETAAVEAAVVDVAAKGVSKIAQTAHHCNRPFNQASAYFLHVFS